MEILEKTEVTKELIQGLVQEMCLNNTHDSLTYYHDANFSNYEILEHGEIFLSVNVRVWTSTKKGFLKIDDLQISEVDFWLNEDENVDLSDEMHLVLANEINKKIKELI